MLEAINLTKRFGATVALDSLNLAVRPGDIYCLLGANGAGKTTTINLFLGFIEPSSGEARVNGVDVQRGPDATKGAIAYIPETVALYPHLTGMENLEYFAGLSGHEASRETLGSALGEAGLKPEAYSRKVAGYSKGMRQKVVIALAIVRGAKAMLLDEPTSGLDPHAANDFGALLRRMTASGVAVLMATHDLFRGKDIATTIGIMKQGVLGVSLSASEVSHTDLEHIYL
ncbi:MAG: ABC transporter ATP-binding protein, partial [Nitrospira sp.]